MSLEEQGSSSRVYRDRYVAYEKIYKESTPDPVQSPPTNSDVGAAKTALTRQVRYNKQSTKQSVIGGKNDPA